ncbi:hypothetical protein M441DRAFT_42545 [Trichoderma asperellum CBS 433.97]|uniref:Uncharacterized protein n=1 Tax=Trichoderma asperellum (strain ATCC 204424 / CBS 433.97 / NBRC 101777) TaxID=1042311 RepID=A0A2T3ZPS4_TRIA4|nr:hypothetical protein M441DRAFT_42545 [Trichoderma asperellum CBS 433.97]PTB46791.1 hypothetical protein M441DRAFT_42545 [Trichoderma asperellum CBS 433.97]
MGSTSGGIVANEIEDMCQPHSVLLDLQQRDQQQRQQPATKKNESNQTSPPPNPKQTRAAARIEAQEPIKLWHAAPSASQVRVQATHSAPFQGHSVPCLDSAGRYRA